MIDVETERPPAMYPEPDGLPRWKLDSRKLRPMWREVVPPKLLHRLLDPVWFWMLLGTYEDVPIRFDPWQIVDLRDYSRVRFREKAPQIGFSWLRACEAVWEAVLCQDSLTGFVSVDQREASEKVLYALKLYDGLPEVIKAWVPITRSNVDQLDFGDPARPSRIMSIPATAALRGRRMTQVVLDEADFYKDGGMDMFRVAMGRIAHGGRVSMGSTCFGQDTMIDKGMQQVDEEMDASMRDVMRVISRARYTSAVVENPEVLETIELARSVLDPDAFAEEYDCIRGGLGSAPFPADLIRRQTHSGATLAVLDDNELVWPYPADQMAAGYDVGKTRNPSVLSLAEKRPGEPWMQIGLVQPRNRTGGHLSLPDQHEWLRRWMTTWPQLKLCVDSVGIGAHMAQALEKEFGRRRVIQMHEGAKPVDRPNHPMTSKEMVTETKRQLEADELQLLPDREQAKQFRRVKRKPNGDYELPNVNDKRDDTHYDQFKATVYLSYLLAEYGRLDSVYNHRGLTVVGGTV
jgi:phage FluMu gp28-like protein